MEHLANPKGGSQWVSQQFLTDCAIEDGLRRIGVSARELLNPGSWRASPTATPLPWSVDKSRILKKELNLTNYGRYRKYGQ
jgi:hypothetical protein